MGDCCLLVLEALLEEEGTSGETEQPLPGISALGCGRGWVGSWRWQLRVAYPQCVPLLCPSQHLQQHESGVEGESCYYHCVLCNYSTKAKLNLIQHVRSMKHQRSESLRKLQRLQKGLPEEDEDLGQIFTIRRCPSTDPGEWSRGPIGEWSPVGPWCGPPVGFGSLLLLLVSIADLTGDHRVLEGTLCAFLLFF